MVFSSILFLVYFLPIFLITYYLIPSGGKYKNAKNYHLLLFSILFYGWGAPKFIFLVLGATFSTFYLVKQLNRLGPGKPKRLLLTAAVAVNLGLLLYFKYANFFIENINQLLGQMGVHEVSWTRIALPIGISFFTFQSLTYAVDVYRGVHKPLKKASDYILYILMFPQLIAGPIVRFNTIADQIESRGESWDDRLLGLYRFCIGLAKKVFIANTMGQMADGVMALDVTSLNSTTAWMGLLAYTFQIYFDFSGYSDMAIGIGRMIGFSYPENFNSPYISRSITEFWRRWHITLGAWMKDYLYIPLGGNRVKSKYRLFFNLWFVFLVSGFWHGASWNFLIWGAFHGFFLILDRLFLQRVLDAIGKTPATLFTFFIAMMGWVVFRIETLPDALIYYQKLFAFDFSSAQETINSRFIVTLFFAAFFSFVAATAWGRKWQEIVFYGNASRPRFIKAYALSVLIILLCISQLSTAGFNPFIYFKF